MERPQTLMEFIKEIQNERFYGEVVIKFEAGKITVTRLVKSIKLASE